MQRIAVVIGLWLMLIGSAWSDDAIRTLKGHTDVVTSVAFSYDGHYAISGSWDKTIKLWDVASGQEIRVFKGHAARVNSVSFSPDGQYAISGSNDKTIKLWGVASGQEIRTFKGHAAPVNSVSFSPDGQYAISGSNDKTIKLWGVASGQEIRTFKGHTNDVTSVAFSSDGRYVLSKSYEIKLWDVASGQEIKTFKNSHVRSIAFSPDGRYVLSGGFYGEIKFWNVASGQELSTFNKHASHVNSVAFSPDGQHILSGGYDKTLKLWSVQKGEFITFTGHTSDVNSATFSPDGRHVLSGSTDGTLKLWENFYAPISISHTELLSSLVQRGFSLQKHNKDNKLYACFIHNRWYVGTKEQILLRNSNISSTDPFARIDELFQKQLAILIPPEVPMPTLPAMKELVKDEFETKTAFEVRVAQAIKVREDEIAALQAEYRRKVEERNAKIENFRPEYEAFMKSDELGAGNTPLYKQIEDAMIASFQTVMGGVKLSNAAYDAENQTMYIDLNATNASYGKRITIHVSLVEAKAFKESLAQLNPTATFAFKSGALILKEIKVANKNKEYLAMLADKDFKPEMVSVALKDKKIDFNLNLQNPNLIDRYQVQALGYSEAANLTRLGAKDDLTPLVAKMKATSKTSNKWLFAIAVENYAEADPVIFAKNSAEAFVAAAKKRFGIDDRHTYAYIDDKATGSGIKNNLERFLENIKDGDTIYFYYSGHGIPSPVDGEAFILPRDAIADYITKEQEFMARTIYKKLSESKAGKVFAFVDSCYSGKTDNIANIKGVAAGVFKTKKVEFDKNKMVVMTAGTSGQFSNAFNEKGHRLFTYYLTKAIIERPTLDMESLYQEVALKVKDESFKKGDIYRQEPQIEGNMKLELLK